MPERTREELEQELEFWEGCLAENPYGGLAPAMMNRCSWLRVELERLRNQEK